MWPRCVCIVSENPGPLVRRQIAHVDVNSFYVSAERAFDPTLRDRPCIVLSNKARYSYSWPKGTSSLAGFSQLGLAVFAQLPWWI